MVWRGVRTPVLVGAVFTFFGVVVLVPGTARAQGECSGGVCGTPPGGECSGGVCGVPQDGLGPGALGWIEPGWTCSSDETYQYADDYDEDGYEDDFDNCPFVDNKSQLDTDGDKRGDACDVCPNAPDTDQVDTDGDGVGDVCDPDKDNDGLDNGQDNCPLISNFEQLDTDSDEVGDVCDEDDDNDKVLDTADNCPLVANPMQEPPDQLGNPKCDTDVDLDLVPDSRDNCRAVANADQKDTDGDKLGDKCDTDLDGDTVLNVVDNCPDLINADQADQDRDGKGDACDNRNCYVVNGDEKNCLDPLDSFKVYSPFEKVATASTEPPPRSCPYYYMCAEGTNATRLRLFANRVNTPIRYHWEVVKRPEGSEAKVEHPKGLVVCSTPYEYHYWRDREAKFTADYPGEYQIKLQADLVFQDTVNPSYPNHAEYVVTVIAEGDPPADTWCSAAPARRPPGCGAWLVLALGLGLALRRRRA